MIAAALCGAGLGSALLVAWRALVPADPPLETAVKRFRRLPAPVSSAAAGAAWKDSLGRRARAALAVLGIEVTAAVERDLAVLDRTAEHHLADKSVAAVAGLLLPLAWASIASVALGLALPASAVVLLAGGLAIGGFFLPDITLRTEAASKRRDFRLALGSFLDLVVVNLAGGAGVESALAGAADVGASWSFVYLRQALSSARLSGDSPWTALGQLGARIGADELVELAATVSLAGTEGSKVRESLVAKAGAMRDRELAEAEARAQSATERMALPTVMLMAGFIALVGYPAVRGVMTGL